jgi:hypothetical protein
MASPSSDRYKAETSHVAEDHNPSHAAERQPQKKK